MSQGQTSVQELIRDLERLAESLCSMLELARAADDALPNSTDEDRCRAILSGQGAIGRLALDKLARVIEKVEATA
jgi:hypothetical protein